MNFHDALVEYGDDIRTTGQWVPGLDHDDVVSEMTICLWKATRTYERGETGFGAYWWSIWRNRRTDLIRDWNRHVQAMPMGEFVIDQSYDDQYLPAAPLGSTEQEQMIWELLAMGSTAKEVIEDVEISKRGYYKTLRGWATDDVWDVLV